MLRFILRNMREILKDLFIAMLTFNKTFLFLFFISQFYYFTTIFLKKRIKFNMRNTQIINQNDIINYFELK